MCSSFHCMFMSLVWKKVLLNNQKEEVSAKVSTILTQANQWISGQLVCKVIAHEVSFIFSILERPLMSSTTDVTAHE